MDKSAFRFTGEGAINYDTYLGPLLFEPYAIELVSQVDANNLHAVLEVACGTGRVTRHLRKKLPADVTLIATDLTSDMLEVAKQKIGDASISYEVADLQHLPFADNSFDLVICQFGMMFLDDKQSGVNEAYRVLKPGGKFIFSTWDDTMNIPILKIIFNDTLLPFFNEADPSRFLLPYLLHHPAELESWMKKAGFSNYEVKRTPLDVVVPAPMDIVNGFVVKHSLGKEVSRRDPAALEPMARILEKNIGEQFGHGPVSYSLTAFICTAEK